MIIQDQLEAALREAIHPEYLTIENDSHLHGGPQRDLTRVRESHFRVVIVSEQFLGKRPAQQHQLVYRALSEHMKQIHALALHTYSPAEWAARGEQAPASPACPKS